MKTLYININGDNIQSTEDIIVVGNPEDAIVNKFYYELGKEILKGVDASVSRGIDKKGIITGFMALNQNAYDVIWKEWEIVKDKLLGETPTGSHRVMIPTDYINWLNNNRQIAYSEIAKKLHQRDGIVEISIDKIYRNAIGILVNSIEPNEILDCNQFVVNDNTVKEKSAISIAFLEKVKGIVFVLFEDYEKNSQDSFIIIAYNEKEDYGRYEGVFPSFEGVSVYDHTIKQVFNAKTVGVEYQWGYVCPGDLRLYIKGRSTCYMIGFDASNVEVKYEETPWGKKDEYPFDRESFLIKHPEYRDCYFSYHGDIISCNNEKSRSSDIWTIKGELLCKLPSNTALYSVLYSSGLFVLRKWIDEDYLAYGIADKNGNILLPCQYCKHHRKDLYGAVFSEVAPGVICCDDFPNESHSNSRYKNLFNGDYYFQITKDFYVKKYKDNNIINTVLIDRENKKELHHFSHDCGVTELKCGWYFVSYFVNCSDEGGEYEVTQHKMVNKSAVFDINNQELLYEGCAASGFSPMHNGKYMENPFISESHVITMEGLTSGVSGLEILSFATIRIYNSCGELIRDYNFNNLPLLIKSPYKYGKALCLRIQNGVITTWYFDSKGKEHEIPNKGGFVIDDYAGTEMFMVSENAFVINKKEGGHCGELRSINGDVLFSDASWICGFSEKYLTYYALSGGKYGIIDKKGNKIIPPNFVGFELVEKKNGEYRRNGVKI